MRIALLTDGIWPFVIGGMQKHSYYLCKYFALRGIFVDLYYTTNNKREADLYKCFDKAEMNFIRPVFIKFPESDKLPGHYLRSSYKYSELIFRIYCQSDNVDVIYAQGLTAREFFKVKDKNLKLPPVCINVHGYEYYQKTGSLKSSLEQYILRGPFNYVNEHADYIFSYGGGITEIIKKYIKNRKGQIIEIPAGIEKEYMVGKAGKVNDPIQFVYLGRYERRKGVEELMQVIRNIERTWNFHFHFIGNIPDKYKIVSPSVTYHGILDDRHQIMDILGNSDVLICPSYAEGMPNVILEGMASGCAIIATDVGAVSLQVGPDNGWLIEPGSVAALQNAMQLVLETPGNQLQLKKSRSLDLIRQFFLMDQIIDSLISAIKKIIKTENSDLQDV